MLKQYIRVKGKALNNMAKMSKAQAGRKGGLTTKGRYGSGYYSRIGKKGASKGGNATKARHGSGFFSQIGAKGGRARKG
jgi:hypothetical protein